MRSSAFLFLACRWALLSRISRHTYTYGVQAATRSLRNHDHGGGESNRERHAAQRQLQQQSRPSALMRDPRGCPLESNLFDERHNPSSPFMQEHQTFRDTWLETYNAELQPDTMASPDDILITLPRELDASVIYWGWKHMSWQMSAYSTEQHQQQQDGNNNNNTTIFAITNVVTNSMAVERLRLTYIHPSTFQGGSDIQHEYVLDDGGDYVAFFSMFTSEYQHLLIDHVGYLAYLREQYRDRPEVKFLLLDCYNKQNSGALKRLLRKMDPEFESNVHWLPCDAVRRCTQKVTVTNGGSLTVVKHAVSTRHGALLQMARNWILDGYTTYYASKGFDAERTMQNRTTSAPILRTIIYYTRRGHSRAMAVDQEELILQEIQHMMQRFGRTEELVLFNGQMGIADQIDLFRSASMVIGPHGGGLSNIMWMLPGDDCESRPQVLEFATSPETSTVHDNGDDVSKFDISFYTLMSMVPWVQWNQLFFTPPSTHAKTYIDLHDLRQALAHMMEGTPTRANTIPSI
jgi:hypothetical protein